MRRALATTVTVLLLGCALAGCSDDGSEASGSPSEASSESASESGSASEPALRDLPAPAPELPTARPVELAASGAAFDACTVLSPDLVTEVFGTLPGQSMPQEPSLGDPAAADCYYFGSDTVIVAQATTRADDDLPESSYTYDGIPGAVTVPGADRGWAIIFPGQEGSNELVSGLILVKDGKGLNLAISIAGHPYDDDTLLELADRLLQAM